MSFSYEKKITKAYPFRAAGSTLVHDEQPDLKIVYDKYKTRSSLPHSKNQLRYNFIFCHGTGFNKSIWKYHITRLYQLSQSMQVPWFLDSVIALDMVGHGDSSLENQGKISTICRWDDGARDVVEVLRHEIETTGDFKNNLESRNIIIGHSMGGFNALYAAFLAPTLFDGVIPIEPVIYGQPGGLKQFTKIFKKISKLLIDTFDSLDDVNFFFKEFSFYKTLDPKVIDDFIKDEVYPITDKESGETKYKIKCNTAHQMAAYYGAFMSIKYGMLALPLIRVPVCHVIGSKAVWNPKESITWIRSAINPEFLAETVDVPNGEHLLNVDLPDETVEFIKNFTNKRNDKFLEEKQKMPEVVFKGDKQAIAKQEFDSLIDLRYNDVYGYFVEDGDEKVKELYKL
ncbi:LPX1 Peroxisomal membrane protein LPX1 [Candida maltosa Xu316]|uniref:Putative peroxisomal matrix protein n=1 Tax=Candida maltosa (strain Xu316) TaxID=1245528 RepID=M3IQP4_CANMX|nr:putative peroxisomal matrix protein [Candida maltosa Xu316]